MKTPKLLFWALVLAVSGSCTKEQETRPQTASSSSNLAVPEPDLEIFIKNRGGLTNYYHHTNHYYLKIGKIVGTDTVYTYQAAKDSETLIGDVINDANGSLPGFPLLLNETYFIYFQQGGNSGGCAVDGYRDEYLKFKYTDPLHGKLKVVYDVCEGGKFHIISAGSNVEYETGPQRNIYIDIGVWPYDGE